MKKKEKIIALIAIILGLMCLLNIFQVVGIFKIASSNMEPQYERDSYLFGGRFYKKINRKDVIGFNRSGFPESEMFLSRVVGIEGEELVIKEGRAYIDGDSVDDNLILKFAFNISLNEYKENKKYFKEISANDIRVFSDRAYVYLTSTEFKRIEQKVELERIDNKFNSTVSPSNLNLNENWSRNNFGPVKIPADHVFVLGDFRDNSEDSRYFGFVSINDIKVKIWN